MLKFSIVIPLYNKENNINDTLKSVLNQTYSSFEILIIDDGSTDNSLKSIKGIIDKKICLIKQQNQGVAAARNKGIKAAKGEYVCFLDADDLWYPDFLATINKLIEKYPDAGAYCTGIDYFYKNKKQYIEYPELSNKTFEGYVENYFKTFSTGISIMMSSNICVKKSVFRSVGLFEVGVSHTEDTDMWSRIALAFPIVYTVKSCARYNVDDKIRYTDSVFFIVDSLQDILNKGKVSEKFEKDVEKVIEYQLLMSALAMLLSDKKEESKKILEDHRLKNTGYRKKKVILYILSFLPHALTLQIMNLWKRMKVIREKS